MESMCPPGGRSYADRRNWHPATTLVEYLANCREGLEPYSDRRAAKLLGWSRANVQRARDMAGIPDDLFDQLIAKREYRVPSTTELALIGQALQGRGKMQEIERCPHCDFVLRVRSRIRKRSVEIVLDWLQEQRGQGSR